MDCNIIRDLMPLCIDNCCSEQSSEQVMEHIALCSDCKTVYDSMSAPSDIASGEPVDISAPNAPTTLHRVNLWKASVLQSVLLLVSFALITYGVYYESHSNYDSYFNGYFAYTIVIPVTGFMLSLISWHFVHMCKNRRQFSWISCFCAMGITFAATVWTTHHYGGSVIDFIRMFFENFSYIFDPDYFLYSLNSILFFVLVSGNLICAPGMLSKLFAILYAKLLGKQ